MRGARSLVPGWRIGRPGDSLFYDENMVKVLARYVTFGLDPGNFGRALLAEDERRLPGIASFNEPRLDDLKFETDAPEFKKNVKQKIWVNMLAWTRENVPEVCRGGDKVWEWVCHRGLYGAPKDIRALVKLSYTDYWFIDVLAKESQEMFSWEGDPDAEED